MFGLVFKLIREALRVGIPPIFYHDQLFRRTARTPSVGPDDMPELVLPPTLVNEWPKEQFLAFSERHRDVLEKIERGDMDVRSFIEHVETIPRSLLDARSIAPIAFNVYETCLKIADLLSDAKAFWG